MSQHTSMVGDRDFVVEVLEAELPVLVDFWSFWCGPCQQRAALVDRVAAQYAGLIKVVRFEVDDNLRIPAAFDVDEIPSLLLFHRGRCRARQTGAVTKREILALLDEHMPPKPEWPLLRRAAA